jgi:PAS domain S-box-containing protein
VTGIDDVSPRTAPAGAHHGEVPAAGTELPGTAIGSTPDHTVRADISDGPAHAELLLRAVQDYAIFTLDLDGYVTSWNLGAERIKGYQPSEIVGRHFSVFYPSDDIAAGSIERELDEVVTTGRAEDESWRVRKDGTRFWANTVFTAILDDEGVLIGFGNITRDMSERKQFIDELQTARDAAEQANRAKDEFLSHVSHELRTPLNAVIGFSQVLEMGDLTGRQRESVAHIGQAGHHLLGLIDEIMDIARVASGDLSINAEPVNVVATVDECIGLVRPLALDIGVRVTAESTVRLDALADPQRLRQVLLNLVSNAVKYNRPGGSVAVSWEATTIGHARIVVADTGFGISAEDMHRLFVPFDRLGAESTGTEGTGLGLTLSKSLVESMGGTIEVTSDPGHGSTFTVDLPAPANDANAWAATAFVAAAAPTAHVLYIEDNVANLELVRQILANRPTIAFIPAMDGQAGLNLARTNRPDLVLLDLNLPDLSGEQVLHELRRQPATADVPIVVMSADAEPGRIAVMRALGVVDYLTKPINVHGLLAIVDSHIPRPALLERR